jgi:hypothetical protein
MTPQVILLRQTPAELPEEFLGGRLFLTDFDLDGVLFGQHFGDCRDPEVGLERTVGEVGRCPLCLCLKCRTKLGKLMGIQVRAVAVYRI